MSVNSACGPFLPRRPSAFVSVIRGLAAAVGRWPSRQLMAPSRPPRSRDGAAAFGGLSAAPAFNKHSLSRNRVSSGLGDMVAHNDARKRTTLRRSVRMRACKFRLARAPRPKLPRRRRPSARCRRSSHKEIGRRRGPKLGPDSARRSAPPSRARNREKNG